MAKKCKRICLFLLTLPFWALFIWEFMAHNQQKSLAYLHQNVLTKKVIPHEVNTPERLKSVLDDGLYALEMDLRFSESEGVFWVGHDKKSVGHITLANMLQAMPIEKITKIWLDIKNINTANIPKIKAQLLALDATFNLKEKLIVESSANDPLLRTISDEGFHTSYYLPTKTLRLMLEEGDKSALGKYAESIVRQVETQKLSAVSFDYRIYPFISRYLDAKLPKHVVYHTWDTTIRMIDYNFIDKLKEADYFNDPRVKSFIVVYLERNSLLF